MTSIVDQLWEDAGVPLIQELYGTTVSFQRGEQTTEDVPAIADTVDYPVFDDSGFFQSVSSRDYTLPVSETKIGGVAVQPQRGDKIHETINGVLQVFEVSSPGKLPACTPSPSGTQWIVHTKRVASA
jgi:hypothetical protein